MTYQTPKGRDSFPEAAREGHGGSHTEDQGSEWLRLLDSVEPVQQHLRRLEGDDFPPRTLVPTKWPAKGEGGPRKTSLAPFFRNPQ